MLYTSCQCGTGSLSVFWLHAVVKGHCYKAYFITGYDIRLCHACLGQYCLKKPLLPNPVGPCHFLCFSSFIQTTVKLIPQHDSCSTWPPTTANRDLKGLKLSYKKSPVLNLVIYIQPTSFLPHPFILKS